jgi:uncharacterized protein
MRLMCRHAANPASSLALAVSLMAIGTAALAQGTSPAAGAPTVAPTATAAATHRLVIQISDADPAKWNLALNNVRNVQAELGRDKVAVEIVAYGPGIGMLKMDSVAGARVAEAIDSGVRVLACENTMTNQKLVRADMLPRIAYAPSGVVQLMQRQQQGYAYIRP